MLHVHIRAGCAADLVQPVGYVLQLGQGFSLVRASALPGSDRCKCQQVWRLHVLWRLRVHS